MRKEVAARPKLLTPHELLGRRLEFTKVYAPDFTVIAYSEANDSLLVHFRDENVGVRQQLSLSLTLLAIKNGHIIESALAPFVLPRFEGITI